MTIGAAQMRIRIEAVRAGRSRRRSSRDRRRSRSRSRRGSKRTRSRDRTRSPRRSTTRGEGGASRRKGYDYRGLKPIRATNPLYKERLDYRSHWIRDREDQGPDSPDGVLAGRTPVHR